MKNFDIYVNGQYFDSLHFPSRKTVAEVTQYVWSEMRLVGNVSIDAIDEA